MLDMFIFETVQLITQLEQSILCSEKASCYNEADINEIFRIMHTIKGSSAMMLFNNISALAHSIEDLFFFLREEKLQQLDCSMLCDLVLEGVDFIKVEIEKIKNGDDANGDASILIGNIEDFLALLKQENSFSQVEEVQKNADRKQQYYIRQEKIAAPFNTNVFRAIIHFEEGCEMENIRAYTVIHNIQEITQEFCHFPQDIIDNNNSSEVIREKGFKLLLKTNKTYEEVYELLMQTIFLKELQLTELQDDEEFYSSVEPKNILLEDQVIKVPKLQEKETKNTATQQNMISVSVTKLDKLMDLMGEMVIAEAMVIQNPDLRDLNLDNFHKAAAQLHKITNELQDVVMSIRMVSLSATFHKMHRIVRDMSKKLDKEVVLEIIGEETEVDKNIIEHISDPLMHLVRNAIDHGIETPEEREKKGKAPRAIVTLEAKNAGSDVLVIVKDDGKGLNKHKILQRAKENGLLSKVEDEMRDREIYNLILLPGFSTKDSITEFSGRGVGMDVVTKNIETIGGSISVDSIEDKGTIITLKIPITLAIIDGMNIRVGTSRYTLPIMNIKESFRPKEEDIIKDPDGNEMIMIRSQCYPILRLHQIYGLKTETEKLTEGILIMVEQDDKSVCIFADELLGQQQVVVKPLPTYIKNIKKIGGLAGCTLLGDGNISLILDIAGLINFKRKGKDENNFIK
nr:chemotaxis protein CheA [Clostridium formicaceticum]